MPHKGYKQTESHKAKYRRTGKNNSFYGKKHTKETKNKIGLANSHYLRTPESNEKRRRAALKMWENPEHRSKSKFTHNCTSKNKISLASKAFWFKTNKKEIGKKISLGLGGTGIPYEHSSYPQTFNKPLKDQIRKRDNYKCQNCSMDEGEHLSIYSRVLEVHHIDYDRQNNTLLNLITLCKQCNLRANKNRNYWKEFYRGKLQCCSIS